VSCIQIEENKLYLKQSKKFKSQKIKSNAKTFKMSLNEFKEDFKAWCLGWAKWAESFNDNLYDKSSQFFFRQHLENGAFVSKQYMNQKEKEIY
jgi:hypothetical protein